MKIGVVYPQIEMRGDPTAIREFGQAVERLGYDHIGIYDHVLGAMHADREPPLTGPYTETDPFHDPFMFFAYLAGLTSTIEFATEVLVLPQRQTALVARQAADLDLLCGERFRLGIGTGWNYVEYDSLGIDYAGRGRRMDEQVEVLRALWRDPLVTFNGEFHQIDRAALIPRPKRSIPIWTGGRTMPAYRRAARAADGFMFHRSFAEIEVALEHVREELRAAGRADDAFGLEALMSGGLDRQVIMDQIERWRELGGTHATVVSLGRGFDAVQRHLAFYAELADDLLGRGFLTQVP